MKDHTKEGVPISDLTTAEIEDALGRQIKVLDGDGYNDEVARQMIIDRLRLELQIRNMGIR